jgi:ABC-type branched-subunit amino acid transport system ATPase component/ABC-type branched-subunit amino acid transport system permease subunit
MSRAPSSERARAITRVFAPSACLLATSILGLALGTYWQYVLAISISAAIIGGALSMLVGYARCITIATGAMMAIGAYGAAIPVVHAHVPFLAAVVFATVLGAIAGFILAVPGVRFRSHNLAMVTLVFQAVVIIVLRESKALTGGAEGLNVPPPAVFGISFSGDGPFLLLCGVLAALIILPMAILLDGPFGKNLRAVASNENAARAFGINVRHHLIAAFAWSSAVIAFAGAISAPRFRIIDPDSYGVLMSIFTLAYPIIGGMGSIWGGLIGGGVLRIVPELLRPLADYIELIFCVLVVATLTFFPDGIASAVRERLRAHGPRAAAAPGARELQPARVAELLSSTATLADASPDRAVSDAPMLRIEGVSKSYDALRAVDGVSLSVASRALHGLMGPNGAGKTTLFNVVSGFIPPDTGRVLLNGAPLDAVSIERRITLGMTRTFQHAAVFQRLSCLDNVMIGLGRNGVWRATMRSVGAAFDTADTGAERRAALAALEAVGLGGRSRDEARALSLGDQRRLELARAIVSRPQLILLDEPVSGVAVEEAHRLRELLLAINRELGIAMVVIEHNIGFLVSLCHSISVMSEGRIIAEGDAAAVVRDPRVRLAYFGEQEAAA